MIRQFDAITDVDIHSESSTKDKNYLLGYVTLRVKDITFVQLSGSHILEHFTLEVLVFVGKEWQTLDDVVQRE